MTLDIEKASNFVNHLFLITTLEKLTLKRILSNGYKF